MPADANVFTNCPGFGKQIRRRGRIDDGNVVQSGNVSDGEEPTLFHGQPAQRSQMRRRPDYASLRFAIAVLRLANERPQGNRLVDTCQTFKMGKIITSQTISLDDGTCRVIWRFNAGNLDYRRFVFRCLTVRCFGDRHQGKMANQRNAPNLLVQTIQYAIRSPRGCSPFSLQNHLVATNSTVGTGLFTFPLYDECGNTSPLREQGFFADFPR